MAEKTRNLCAQIPVELHDKVRQRQAESGNTLSQYMTALITQFYEMEERQTTDPIHTRELRAYAVDEVKRTNGQVSFESAVHQQRRVEPDDAWPESY